MQHFTAETVIATWLTVSLKTALLYLVAAAVTAAALRRRAAWRSWVWLMVVMAFPVLTLLELTAGGSAWAGRVVCAWPQAVTSLIVQAAGLVAVVLFGLLIHSLVRLSLWRRYSLPMRLGVGLSDEGQRALGPALRLLRHVQVLRSDAVDKPTSFGIIRPTIILPATVTGAVYRRLVRSAVLHEFVAVLRFDALWTLIGRLGQCVYFANPLAWWAFRKYRRASEEACAEWAILAIGDHAEYADDLRPLVSGRWGWSFMSADTPLSAGVACAVATHRERWKRPPEGRPDAVGRRWLTLAVVAALVGLALLGAARALPAASGAGRFDVARRTLTIGLGVAAAAGAVMLAASGRRGHRCRSPGDHDDGVPGAYRQTLADCVRWMEPQWQEVQAVLGVAWRTAVPLLLLALFVSIMVLSVWHTALKPEPMRSVPFV